MPKKHPDSPMDARRVVSLNGADWMVGQGYEPSSWIPAQVPGNVQRDLWRAGRGPDPYVGTNAERYRGLEGAAWVYTCRFAIDPRDRPSWTLLFEGIDYAADFTLNDVALGSHEGAYGPAVFDVTRHLRRAGNELRVVIHPLVMAPRASRAVVDPLAPERHDGRWMVKPLMSFFWDFAPRLLTVGIWKDVSLVGTRGVRLEGPRTDCALDEGNGSARLAFHAVVHSQRARTVTATLELRESGRDEPVLRCSAARALPAGESTVTLEGALAHPRLWWPSGAGEAFLYEATLRMGSGREVLDGIRFPVGIRTVHMARSPRDQAEEVRIPAGPLKDETTLVVNGRPIPYRGIDMAPLDILFGSIDDARIERQLQLVRDGNINCLRLWGGGVVNRPIFYDLADRYGIMLWQEFPMGCTDHAGSEHYRDVLATEAAAMVRTLRHHPSLVLWLGGNEMFLPQSGMGPTDRLVRMVGSICYQLDPERVFVPSTPYPGSFHGPYTFDCYGQGGFGAAVDHVQFCNSAPAGGYNECGVAGPAPASLIRRSAGAELPWPPRPGSVWQFHKAFGAWGAGATWLMPELIERYFGPIDRLEDLCRAGQFLQAIGLQYLLEEMRRRWPDVPGTMPWCFNTPWTSFAGSFVVAYPDQPMPAYYALRAAYAPRNVSARLESFLAQPGQSIGASLFLCNDGAPVTAGRVTLDAGSVEGRMWINEELPAPYVGTMERAGLGKIEIDIPPSFEGVARLALGWEHDGEREENASYIGVSDEGRDAPCFRPLLSLWERDPRSRWKGME